MKKVFDKVVTLVFISFALILLFKLVIPAIFAFSSLCSVILAGTVAIIVTIALLSLIYFFFTGN